MKFSHEFTSFILINITGAVVGFGIFSFTEKGVDKSRSLSSSESSSTASAKSLWDLKRSQASETLQLAEKGDPQVMAKFVKNWLTLHPEDQDYIVGQLAGWYYDDADSYYEFIRDFSLQIFSQNRALSLKSVSVFSRDERIRNLERHLLAQWVSLDQDEILSSIFKDADESLSINGTHMHQLASIYGSEHAENYDDFISWVNELDPENQNLSHLQRVAYDALSLHCPEAHRPELYAQLMKKAESSELLQHLPAVLLGQHAIKNPEEATNWLEEMKPGPWKDQALYRFLDSTGQHQPLAGANLMNREQFLAEFAVPWEQADGGEIRVSEVEFADGFYQEFYDSSLEHFLNNALDVDPDLVFESAEAFYNPALKKDFQIAAKSAAAGGFTPISSSPHDSSCGPNCTHEHHQ